MNGLFLCCCLLAVVGAEAENPTAKVAFGTLIGRTDPETGVVSFKGIPYAQPPVGELRWRPPVAFGGWNGTLDATRFGAPCVQPTDGGWSTIENLDAMSEDCLFLNVVAPRAALGGGGAALPVLVYLHAGEFHYGAASDAESDWPHFAPDVVYVSPNSRLGPLGFLASEDLRGRSRDGSTGSYGMLDQREALAWVQRHIRAFGGDASRVTLMGESSGGTSVLFHLVSRPSWPLFHRVVLESAGYTQVDAPPYTNLSLLTNLILKSNREPPMS